MGLDDFTTQGTKPATRTSTSPEDEDLFDFPLIEMVLQKKAPRPQAASPFASGIGAHGIGAQDPFGSPAAPLPAQAAAPRPTTLAHPTQAASETIAAANDLDPFAPHAAHVTHVTHVPSTDALGAHAGELDDLLAATPANDVASAPDLGADDVDDDGDAEPTLRRARRAKRSALALYGSPAALLVGMLTLNLLTFGFFWHTSETFRQGLQGLRDELVLATEASALARAPAGERTPPAGHAPVEATQAPERAADEHEAAAPGAQPAHPLASFEQTTLDLAAQEVRDGQPLAARRRLYRLLALADRIDAGLRADVEARARFAIAESYRTQAAAKDAVRAGDAEGAKPAGRGSR